MKNINVSFKIQVNDDISLEDIKEWIRFELHDNGSLSRDNPLEDESMEPMAGTLKIEG